MNKIVMIPVERLFHHPENPRLDLGDLTELADSIKKNGVMQNLTVVPSEFEKDRYLVVIGNRRLEAAKMAGLEELPCVISDMDHRTQIATMLEENMQRADLTYYEQAQGFQMMMDLGFRPEEISERTGFSETTVRRRLKMAELDRETLREKCMQLTMDEMDQLSRVQDIGKRNQLLKEAGTSNFKWKVENAITEQQRQEAYQQVKEILLAAGCVERDTHGIGDFWKQYEYLPYTSNINLDRCTAGKAAVPEDKRQLFFCREYTVVRFWAEKRKAAAAETDEDEEADEDEKETAEEKARKKEAEDAWQRLKEIEGHAEESRAEFIRELTVKQKDSRKALEWLLIGLVATNDGDMAMTRLLPDYDKEQLDALPEQHTEADLDLKWIREQLAEDPQLYAKVMDGLFFDGEDSVQYRWRTDEKPKYCRNISMITGYEWLEDFGYRTSDDERAYLDGTLDCYGEDEDA